MNAFPPMFDDLTRSNPNMIWAGALAASLWRLGLREAILSPGSRSAPLALAFSRHPEIETHAVLDERSAAFLAMGIAKRRGRPVALVCTSGTAGAHYFPALIEAHYSGVPLIVLTADRPQELRECHSGQTIRQVGLFGDYPEFETELSLPDLSREGLEALFALLLKAWCRQFYPRQGFVHLNVPFRDPLHPTPDSEDGGFAEEAWFLGLLGSQADRTGRAEMDCVELPLVPRGRGVILAGPAQPQDSGRYCRGVARLARQTGYPVLADALSPLRNHAELNPYLVSGYDCLLRNPAVAAALVPDEVVQLGSLPTSKVLREWLAEHRPFTWLLDPQPDNRDPLNRHVEHRQVDVESLADLKEEPGEDPARDSGWVADWLHVDEQFRGGLQDIFWGCDAMFEGKIPWMLANTLPEDTAVVFANSMPVRDAEYFWPVNSRHFPVFFNRGANGIDGTLSHALGIAHGRGHTVLVTGDLALLHDSNGLLFAPDFEGSLTVVLVQNHGGAIFENLPISRFREGFSENFLTPQAVNFQTLLHAHGVPLLKAETWEAFSALLMEPPGKPGIRVIEVETDPTRDVPFRRKILGELAERLTLPG